MNVLLSIRPEFAFRILSGTKRYEFRRTIFRRGDVKKVLIYATAPVGHIIGEFEIEKILRGQPEYLWRRTKDHAGISRQRFMDYFGGTQKGYAIKIGAFRAYKKPLRLSEHYGVNTAPQSFLYIDASKTVVER